MISPYPCNFHFCVDIRLINNKFCHKEVKEISWDEHIQRVKCVEIRITLRHRKKTTYTYKQMHSLPIRNVFFNPNKDNNKPTHICLWMHFESFCTKSVRWASAYFSNSFCHISFSLVPQHMGWICMPAHLWYIAILIYVWCKWSKQKLNK